LNMQQPRTEQTNDVRNPHKYAAAYERTNKPHKGPREYAAA